MKVKETNETDLQIIAATFLPSSTFSDSNSHNTRPYIFVSSALKKRRFEYPKRTSSITYHWLHGSFIRDFNSILHADFSKAVQFLSFFCPRWDQVLGLSILERPFLRSMSTLHLLRLPTSAFCLTDMTLRTPRVPFLGNKIRYESKTSPFERYFWEEDPVGGGKCTERSKI